MMDTVVVVTRRAGFYFLTMGSAYFGNINQQIELQKSKEVGLYAERTKLYGG